MTVFSIFTWLIYFVLIITSAARTTTGSEIIENGEPVKLLPCFAIRPIVSYKTIGKQINNYIDI